MASPALVVVLVIRVAPPLHPDAKRIFILAGAPGTRARVLALDEWVPFIPIIPVWVLVLLLGLAGIPVIVVAPAAF